MKTIVIVLVITLFAVLIPNAAFADPISISYVDEFNLPDGPTWVVKTTFPSGKDVFTPDPGGSIFVTDSNVAAGLFPGTSPSEWNQLQEGKNTIWVFHSSQPKPLTVPYGKLQIAADKEIVQFQSATLQDATWRFRPTSVGPIPNPSQLAGCPANPLQASLLGGAPEFWNPEAGSEGTGWHFDGPSSWLMAPAFGKIDIDGGSLRNGQSSIVGVATFWCRG